METNIHEPMSLELNAGKFLSKSMQFNSLEEKRVEFNRSLVFVGNDADAEKDKFKSVLKKYLSKHGSDGNNVFILDILIYLNFGEEWTSSIYENNFKALKEFILEFSVDPEQ